MNQNQAGFQPYEGGEPYIFASYSHDDSETILPILDALHKRGFRVWYDQGIGWTDEWRNVVAEHVAGCAVCMAFHSSASQDSKHCKAELYFAEKNNRQILSVYIEKGVRLPMGLQMYLSPYQSVRLFDYNDVNAFLDRMERESVLYPCKIQSVWHYQGGIRWNLGGSGVLTISPKNPSYPARIPPYQYDGITNTASTPWMRYWDKITSVEIENGVTGIGDFAFFGCESLVHAEIADSVTEIQDGAFLDCAKLADIRIPDSVVKIGNWAFKGCTNLKSEVIPGSVTEIGEAAFHDCVSLTNISIPDSVTWIKRGTFYNCRSLVSVIIPDSVIVIGDSAFLDCISLTNVMIPDSVTEIGGSAFVGCEKLKEISLPAGVKFRGNSFPPGAKIRR